MGTCGKSRKQQPIAWLGHCSLATFVSRPASGPRYSFSSVNLRLPVLLLASAVGLSHCTKKEVEPEDQLPPATQAGQSTAGCRVDGLPWTARVQLLFGPKPTHASWLKSPATGGHGLRLSFSKRTIGSHLHASTSIRLFVPDVRAAGTFLLDQRANPQLASTNPPYAAFEFGARAPDEVLLTGPLTTGRLVVTRFDSVSRVVSGTFEFTARETTGAATVQVREGRFDCTF